MHDQRLPIVIVFANGCNVAARIEPPKGLEMP
jgi:hypothetical protein